MKGDSILVVDDEEDTVELARMVLEFEGYRVFSANNGQEAIDFLKKEDEKPNLKVCKWIKENPDLKEIPVLLFTAKVGNKDRMAGEKVGADAYIAKPFSADDLLSLIQTHIDKNKP